MKLLRQRRGPGSRRVWERFDADKRRGGLVGRREMRAPVLTRDGHWEHHAVALAPSVRVMRTGVVAFAAERGASRSAQTDIALAVSEALTNSVIHAFVHRPVGTISILAEAAFDVLHVRINDDGSGMRPRPDSPGMGLGLTLITRLTSSLQLGHGPDGRGTEMRLTFDVPGMRAHPRAPDVI